MSLRSLLASGVVIALATGATSVHAQTTVEITYEVDREGHVLVIEVDDIARYLADDAYRDAVQPLIRSIRDASPYSTPNAPYRKWRFTTTEFEVDADGGVTSVPDASPAPSSDLAAHQDTLRRRIMNAWFPPPELDVKTAPTVEITFELAPDGSVLNVSVQDEARYRDDALYRVTADTLIRSIRAASPYTVPDSPYSTWRFTTLSMDLKEVL